ncbi:class F sortase [Occultella kanbiaonis]|uniref:class F sortase n=1 Tax=Occultella kanbiaonis TaxID=2675754 RepID=UPI0012B8A79B|nr:class F sortase [Occultella kanbiaonis]
MAPAVTVRSADLAATRPAASVAPVRVVYEELGIDVPVDPVGVTGTEMEIPDDANRAGWYRFGPGLDAVAGSVVVAAHAGSLITPRGPFYDLREAEVGDLVTATSATGATVDYVVTSVAALSKATIDLSEHFRWDGEPSLVLITCGGRWDDDRQSYDDNIVVTATLSAD